MRRFPRKLRNNIHCNLLNSDWVVHQWTCSKLMKWFSKYHIPIKERGYLETLWGVGVGGGGDRRLGVPGGIPLKVRAKTKV